MRVQMRAAARSEAADVPLRCGVQQSKTPDCHRTGGQVERPTGGALPNTVAEQVSDTVGGSERDKWVKMYGRLLRSREHVPRHPGT